MRDVALGVALSYSAALSAAEPGTGSVGLGLAVRLVGRTPLAVAAGALAPAMTGMRLTTAVARTSVDEQGVRAVRLEDQADEDAGAALVEPGHEALPEGLFSGCAAGGAVIDDGAIGGDVVLDADGRPGAGVGRPGPRSSDCLL